MPYEQKVTDFVYFCGQNKTKVTQAIGPGEELVLTFQEKEISKHSHNKNRDH